MSGNVVKNVYLAFISYMPWCNMHQGDATMLLRKKGTLDRATSTRFITAGLSCFLLGMILDVIPNVPPILAFVMGMLEGLSVTLSVAGLLFYGRWRRSQEIPSQPPC